MAKGWKKSEYRKAHKMSAGKRGRKCYPQKRCPSSKVVRVKGYTARRCTTRVR